VVDTYVDAKDQVNNWCVAQVKDVDYEQKTVKLSFEGWSPRYDVVLKVNSTKIAAFRSYTQGYTGQQKNAFREFKIESVSMMLLEKKVQNILESKFLCF